MKVTVIPIIIDALGMIPKGLMRGFEELEIEERMETTQNYTLDQPEYWKES